GSRDRAAEVREARDQDGFVGRHQYRSAQRAQARRENQASLAVLHPGLLGCVVQSALSRVMARPVRGSTPPVIGRMVMQLSIGHTLTHRLQPTHSASMTSKCRLPFCVALMAWCEVSSQAM